MFSQKEIDADIKLRGLADESEVLLIEIQKVADQKWESRKSYLLSYKGTDAQIERYRAMEKDADAGLYSDEENAAILAKANELNAAEKRFRDMIEAVRKYLDKLVESGKLKKARRKLEIAKKMSASVTPVDIAKFMN